MGSLSDAFEPLLLGHEFGAVTHTPTVTHYIALTSTTPTDAAAGTELSGSGYARVALTNNTTNWVPSGSQVSNGIAVTFPQATAGWTAAVGFEVWTAASAGARRAWGTLTASRTVATGEVATFAIGTLVVTMD